MKYLKLLIQESLPDDAHITFAYFGTTIVDPVALRTLVDKLEEFKLVYKGADLLGADRDIPADTYEIQGGGGNEQEVRKEILETFGVMDQNFTPWNPHISRPKSKPRHTLHVIGVLSNDGAFSHIFRDKSEWYLEDLKDLRKSGNTVS